MHKIKVLGHRGAMKEGFYENTLSGFKAALETADGFETDAVRSAEGSVFFVHETDASSGVVHYELNRHLATPSPRRTDQLSDTEIKALRLKNGDTLPSIDSLLTLIQQHPKALINIELKAHNTARAVAEKLQQHNISPAHVFVSSFNHAELAVFRALAPQYKIGLLLESADSVRLPMFPWLDTDKDAFYEPYRAALFSSPAILALQPDYIGLNAVDLSAQSLASIQKALPQAQTYIWWYLRDEVPPAQIPDDFFKQLQTFNKDAPALLAIVTNYPKALVAALQKHGLY